MTKWDFELTSESGEKLEVSFMAERAAEAIQECVNWIDGHNPEGEDWSINLLTVVPDDQFDGLTEELEKEAA